jgi:hypothetical protein
LHADEGRPSINNDKTNVSGEVGDTCKISVIRYLGNKGDLIEKVGHR